MLKCITMYDFSFPANVMVIIEEIRILIEFESLKPAAIMVHFVFEEDLHAMKEKLGLVSVSEMNSGIQSGSYFENFGQYIFIAALLVVFVFLLCLLLLICVMIRRKILEYLIQYRKKMMWNGIIRMISISYIDLCICWTCNYRLKIMAQGNEHEESPATA